MLDWIVVCAAFAWQTLPALRACFSSPLAGRVALAPIGDSVLDSPYRA